MFPTTYQLSKDDYNKFVLLLRKGVYPYEYVDSYIRFEETNLPSKACFNCKSNKKQITVEDYKHANNVWDAFNIKNLGEYHDLYFNWILLY